MLYSSEIIATGSYLPKKILTNFDLEKIIDTTDEWITKRTGISQRHIAAENEYTSDMMKEATLSCLSKSNIKPEDIDLIICATATPDLTIPSVSSILHSKLGIKKHIPAFDLQAACSGFVYALTVADSMIKNCGYDHVLVCGGDKMSSLIDWTDRSTAVLFGDGAGAVILKRSKYISSDQSRIIDSKLYGDGKLSDIFHTTGGSGSTNTAGNIKMKGPELFRYAVDFMSTSIHDMLSKHSLTPDDIKMIVPHQANYRILQAVAEKTGISYDKFAITISHHANTSAASIPIALDQMISEGKIKKGDILLFESMAAGLTWGVNLLKL